MHPIDLLPREWVFPEFRGLRTEHRSGCSGTYCRSELDRQPAIPHDPDLAWLLNEPSWEWHIGMQDDGPAQQPITPTTLDALPGRPDRYPLSLRTFADQPELQTRIRSATGCYLALGDFAARTDAGGRLVHFLSDQQWVFHWLLYVDDSGPEAVLGSPEPIGFDLAPMEMPGLPDPLPMDGRIELVVCADSFAEFLYRYWVENEIWYAGKEQLRLPEVLARYAAQM